MEKFLNFFQNSPQTLNTRKLLGYYLALNQRYQVANNAMPLPYFRRKGLPDSSIQAWNHLKNINQSTPAHKPISIYIHIPYCPTRCSFCDCLTATIQNNPSQTLDEYLRHLLAEITTWATQPVISQRPVTTVHLGGGTPLFLGKKRFQTLINSIKQHFNVHNDTEWALETTTSSLSRTTLSFLNDLGFHRLHLGIQSMEDQVRPLLKRRENAFQILEKLRVLKNSNWVTSVDLLVGLPSETLLGSLQGIEQLIDAGIDGFSVYEIHFSNQNSCFAQQYNLANHDRTENYFLSLAISQTLQQAGFRNNLFNHYANERDQNIYFSFPQREEDCLAMGAYADGVFDHYHYRNLSPEPYLQHALSELAPIQGGIVENQVDRQFSKLETALLSGHFSFQQLSELLPSNELNDLILQWSAACLIEEPLPQKYQLTPNGAWFAGTMIKDLYRLRGKSDE